MVNRSFADMRRTPVSPASRRAFFCLLLTAVTATTYLARIIKLTFPFVDYERGNHFRRAVADCIRGFAGLRRTHRTAFRALAAPSAGFAAIGRRGQRGLLLAADDHRPVFHVRAENAAHGAARR